MPQPLRGQQTAGAFHQFLMLYISWRHTHVEYSVFGIIPSYNHQLSYLNTTNSIIWMPRFEVSANGWYIPRGTTESLQQMCMSHMYMWCHTYVCPVTHMKYRITRQTYKMPCHTPRIFSCPIRKEPYILSKEPYILSTEPLILLQRTPYSIQMQIFCKRNMILSHMHDLSLSDHVVTTKRALHSLNRAL